MYELYSRMPANEVVVAAGEWPGSRAFDEAQNMPIVRSNLHLESWGAFGLRSGSAYLAAYRRLSQIVSDQDVDAVHAACCLPEGFLAWMLRRRLGIPFLVYVHGEELNVALRSRELSWMTQRVLQAAQTIVANSRNTAGILASQWGVPPERIRVLHPGVDASRFSPAERDLEVREQLGWGGRPVVLSVGRLQRRKGHAQLLKALQEVRVAVPDVLYAIVGAGEERESLQHLVGELGLQRHVLFHGDLQGDELLHAYQQCDLFALPNIEVGGDIEGFGIVLLEAQSCGRPVLAGDSGGTSETMRVGETGVIVDCRDVDKLAATLRELLKDHDRRERMGIAARQSIQENFDWSQLRRAAQQIFADAFTPSLTQHAPKTLIPSRVG
jgi:phosphatidylinositol alpha-1,6-mannosyltransferase